MVSIQKKGKKYYVVYNITNELGKRKAIWESCDSSKEAKQRKKNVEAELALSEIALPDKKTVSEFMGQFIKLYGEEKWGGDYLC